MIRITNPTDGLQPPLISYVEAVEKANLDRIRQAGRKCELSGYSVHDDLMLGKGQ
jgi:hypothetical protein